MLIITIVTGTTRLVDLTVNSMLQMQTGLYTVMVLDFGYLIVLIMGATQGSPYGEQRDIHRHTNKNASSSTWIPYWDEGLVTAQILGYVVAYGYEWHISTRLSGGAQGYGDGVQWGNGCHECVVTNECDKNRHNVVINPCYDDRWVPTVVNEHRYDWMPRRLSIHRRCCICHMAP